MKTSRSKFWGKIYEPSQEAVIAFPHFPCAVIDALALHLAKRITNWGDTMVPSTLQVFLMRGTVMCRLQQFHVLDRSS